MPNLKDEERFLSNLTEIIDANLSNTQFGVNELAGEMGMSRSNLHRKVKSYTGKSVSTFICDVKLERAKSLLLNASKIVSEVAFECGFHSSTYFSKCFKDHFGYPPGEVRNHVAGPENLESLRQQNEKVGFGNKKISVLYFFAALFILLLLTIIFFVWKPYSDVEVPRDNSLVILPFFNDSPDQERMYFINGIMMAIHDNLGKIKDIRVIDRNAVEHYRDDPKPIPVVAEEMNVSYVLEGSAYRDRDSLRIYVVLHDGRNGQQLWSRTYDVNIEEIFSLQSAIAQQVAEEIGAIITPEEKELIEKIPTKSQTAYDFFLRGRQLTYLYAPKESLFLAQKLYKYSLEYDPEFSYPYIWIGFTWFFLYTQNRIDNSGYVDSINYYAEKALSVDHQSAGAYFLKGAYYGAKENYEAAIEQYDKATDISPNYNDPYEGRGWTYFGLGDYPNSIKSFYKEIPLVGSGTSSTLLSTISYFYATAGFPEKAIEIINEVLSQDGDTLEYYMRLAQSYSISGNAGTAFEYALKAFDLDSTNPITLHQLGLSYNKLRMYDSAQYYFDRYLDWMEEKDRIEPWFLHSVAYTYQKNGEQDKAQYYTIKLYEYYKNTEDHYALAYYFMLRGDIEKVYYHLSELAKRKKYTIYDTQVRYDPVFDEISSEPEFLSIVDQIEARYKAGHEKTRQRLEAEDLL